jgi:regulator-associated protein of mTOR
MQRQEPPIQNGGSATMSSRPPVSNDLVQVVNGNRTSDADRQSLTPAAKSISEASDSARERRASLQQRPSSAPNGTGSSPDDSETDRNTRRPKPLLHRAKSDFGPRGEEPDSQAEDDIQDWGARHGFEDHYASEEYVSQLANVGCTFLFITEFLTGPSLSDYYLPHLYNFWIM